MMVNPFFSSRSDKNLYGTVPNPATIFLPFKSAIDEMSRLLLTTRLYAISELVVAITSISIPLLGCCFSIFLGCFYKTPYFMRKRLQKTISEKQ